MDANVPSTEVDMKQEAKGAAYDGFLDINEKQEFPSEKQEPSKKEVLDLEAGPPKPEGNAEVSAPKAPRAPLTREEALALRIRPMDNIRALTLSTIFVYNAAIQAISTHPQAAQLHETNPKMFIVVTLFAGLTRLLAVPMLFFLAGFTSHFTMVMRARSPLRFVFRRTWKTALTVILYQATAYLAKTIRPLPPVDTVATTPYYATREGVEAVLNGPTFYVLAILALDYIYALFLSINLCMAGKAKPAHIVQTKGMYRFLKFGSIFFVEFWIVSVGAGGFAINSSVYPLLESWLCAANSGELHFPFLYIIAYTAGVHFVHYYKFILQGANTKTSFSSSSIFFIRVVISILLLAFLLYSYVPTTFIPFFDVRKRPALIFQNRGASGIYAFWVVYVLSVIPEAVINLFFTNGALTVAWGKFSRHAHFQVYVQMLYVVGNPIRFFDSIFARWLFIGWMGLWYAHYGGIGAVALGNLAVRGCTGIRGRFRKDAAPIQV